MTDATHQPDPNDDDSPMIRIRRAQVPDVPTLARHRVEMFRDMGVLADDLAAPLLATTRERLPGLMEEGIYLGWVAEKEEGDGIVAGIGVHLRPVLPRPGLLGSGVPGVVEREALVLNAYTEPTHRRKGIARSLVREVLAWARSEGLTRVVLHASDDGRPLYEQLGFVQTNEMRWTGEPPPLS